MNVEKKVFELTDQELEDFGFLGNGSSYMVREVIRTMKEYPGSFRWLTVFQLDCLNLHDLHRPHDLVSPTSSTSSTSTSATLSSQLTELSDTTAVEHNLVSPFEKVNFYYGISDDPPELLFRSDLEKNPFVIPKGRHPALSEKTVHGVSDATLNPIWRSTVAPAIVALVREKERGICLSTLMAVRFSTPDEHGQAVFGPIVMWISVHPNTTNAVSCRDASPDILRLLESCGVYGAEVHWYEGSVEPLSGPSMMGASLRSNPTAYVRRALMAVLGLPLAAEEMENSDSQGSLAFFFHEGRDKQGNPSEKVFGVTNNHVLRKNTGIDYKLERNGARKSYIRVCGSRRFVGIVNETRALMAEKISATKSLYEEIAELESKTTSKDIDQAEDPEVASALRIARGELVNLEEDQFKLDRFLKDLNANWSDPLQRTIGWVDWAPKTCNDVDARSYTLDIGTFELEKSKWKKEFKGNFVYLGGKYSAHEITQKFNPNVANPPLFKYPKDHMFRIQGFVTAERLAKPDHYDELGDAAFIVAKYGQSSDLTFGRYSGLEAFISDRFNHASWEVPIYNYNKRSGAFSTQGDSGSLIFNAEGQMVAVLHSGTIKGFNTSVTLATPAHFIVEQIKLHYPNADFARLEF